jgi:hypothetical protein
MVINLRGKVAYATKLLLQYHINLPSKRFEVLPTLLQVQSLQLETWQLHSIRRLPQDSIILALHKTLGVEQVLSPSPTHLNNEHTQASHPNGSRSNNNPQYSPNPSLHRHQTSLTNL